MTTQPDLDYLQSTQLYRPGRRACSASGGHGAWAPPIDALLAAGYSFMPAAYSDGDHLFRGLQSGLREALARNHFGWFDGDDEMSRVERAMGVYFLTSETSDAVTVSRLPRQPADGGILVLRASVFNERLGRGEAAVMAVGDGGLIFRYPLLAYPLAAADVDLVFVPAHCDVAALPEAWNDRIVRLDGNGRTELEERLRTVLGERGMAPAVPVRSERRPARQSATGGTQ